MSNTLNSLCLLTGSLSRGFAVSPQCVSAANIRVDSHVRGLNVVMFLKQKLSWLLSFLGHFFLLPSVWSRRLSPAQDPVQPQQLSCLGGTQPLNSPPVRVSVSPGQGHGLEYVLIVPLVLPA